ncbi:hypothetical protein JRQ81_009172 [Phrynocephalus forsythii]|uniref:Uncharacterized protein n=1 Tax=Phrynocephalus forsythii TaxID=171643 RepID=A0A9Q0X9F1_9SAUR|nr:hypothetical protein JRQ81_009172 [Phrynocephalus forsythii]
MPRDKIIALSLRPEVRELPSKHVDSSTKFKRGGVRVINTLEIQFLETSFGFYIPQAVQESNDRLSMIWSDLDPAAAVLLEQLAWQRKKSQIPDKAEENSHFAKDVRRAKPHAVHRQGSVFKKFIKSSQRTLLKKMKRSLFRLHTHENNLEDPSLSNLVEIKEQKTVERGWKKTFPKKREAESAGAPSARTIRLTITALDTQEKLSEMVDRLSEPSNSMSKEERLTYMHELLNELNTFTKLLQQQLLLQSPSEATTTPAAI